MSLPDDYVAALQQLALAFARYRQTTGGDAILVGGAATAIYTSGQFPSNDFDVVASRDREFDAAMLEHGFVREHRPGHLLVGYYHPDHPTYGVQQVSGRLFDGRSDRTRLVRMKVESRGAIALPPIEDMIADRLGQHAAASGTDASRLRQAQSLFRLAKDLDAPYLQRRIVEEGGDPRLLEQGRIMEGEPTISLRDFLAEIDARKLALGIVDEPVNVEAMRNKGENRTEAKRELLRRAEQRATEVGLKPTIISHY